MGSISDTLIRIGHIQKITAKLKAVNDKKELANHQLRQEIKGIREKNRETISETLEIIKSTISTVESLIKSSKKATFKMVGIILFTVSLELGAYLSGGIVWLTASNCVLAPVLCVQFFMFICLAFNWKKEVITLKELKQKRVDCICDTLTYEEGIVETY
jgi:hypothetical protein